MAHFAELDQSNVVLRVVVINNDDIKDANGNESELLGKQYCANLFGGNWIQTSYNGSIRKNYAGIGLQYDVSRDAFIGPRPYNTWILDENTCKWIPPIERPANVRCRWNDINASWSVYPSDGKEYYFDEVTYNWVEKQ